MAQSFNAFCSALISHKKLLLQIKERNLKAAQEREAALREQEQEQAKAGRKKKEEARDAQRRVEGEIQFAPAVLEDLKQKEQNRKNAEHAPEEIRKKRILRLGGVVEKEIGGEREDGGCG